MIFSRLPSFYQEFKHILIKPVKIVEYYLNFCFKDYDSISSTKRDIFKTNKLKLVVIFFLYNEPSTMKYHKSVFLASQY